MTTLDLRLMIDQRVNQGVAVQRVAVQRVAVPIGGCAKVPVPVCGFADLGRSGVSCVEGGCAKGGCARKGCAKGGCACQWLC